MSQQPRATDRAFYPLSSPGNKDRFGSADTTSAGDRNYFSSNRRAPFSNRPPPKTSRWDAFTTAFTEDNPPPIVSNHPTSRYSQEEPPVSEKAYDRTEPCIPYESIPKNMLTHLHGSWCLWYTNVPQKTTENFSDCLIPICVISTAEAFWALYSHCIRPSRLPRGTEYHLFREGIKPMWEDPANQNGGTLMLRLRKDKDYLDYFWEALILAMIGEQLGDDICGAVAGKRYADDHLSVWHRQYDPNNQKTLTTNLLRVLRLPEDGPAEYKSHSGFLKSSTAQQA
eukprot:Gregarina_sp_Pseudo_9__5924@NODE_946_length_2042_cov_91_067399_g887_i0_p1_GENE_NODE_946_length_2042_cov_91_067399_g887_i0NODE_946_length_2042_cov_91_067399_g887_i0_p1_ORF_typecomplete_len283_score28_75IF4E/PF01652_18/2_9e46_NODE_946_length_2042_cov_91_067399_g887_i046894